MFVYCLNVLFNKSPNPSLENNPAPNKIWWHQLQPASSKHRKGPDTGHQTFCQDPKQIWDLGSYPFVLP